MNRNSEGQVRGGKVKPLKGCSTSSSPHSRQAGRGGFSGVEEQMEPPIQGLHLSFPLVPHNWTDSLLDLPVIMIMKERRRRKRRRNGQLMMFSTNNIL